MVAEAMMKAEAELEQSVESDEKMNRDGRREKFSLSGDLCERRSRRWYWSWGSEGIMTLLKEAERGVVAVVVLVGWVTGGSTRTNTQHQH